MDLESPKMLTCQELFKTHLDFSLTPNTSRENLLSLTKKKGLLVKGDESFEDLFFLLFLNFIEPHFDKSSPTFVTKWPEDLRAFSRLNEEGWADRFEMYFQGMELSNAFYEVVDAREQEKLFLDHIRKRKDDVPMDKELLDLMKKGGQTFFFWSGNGS